MVTELGEKLDKAEQLGKRQLEKLVLASATIEQSDTASHQRSLVLSLKENALVAANVELGFICLTASCCMNTFVV